MGDSRELIEERYRLQLGEVSRLVAEHCLETGDDPSMWARWVNAHEGWDVRADRGNVRLNPAQLQRVIEMAKEAIAP
jgi:hypothetical protein